MEFTEDTCMNFGLNDLNTSYDIQTAGTYEVTATIDAGLSL